MESPFGRPEVCDFIADKIGEHRDATAEGVCGLSLEMHLYNALKEAGHLAGPVHCPWDCSRCHEGDGVCEPEDGDWDAWEAKHAQ